MTWTDRALLVVGAHIAFCEKISVRYRGDRNAGVCVHWRGVYNRLLARKIRLTKLQDGVE